MELITFFIPFPSASSDSVMQLPDHIMSTRPLRLLEIGTNLRYIVSKDIGS